MITEAAEAAVAAPAARVRNLTVEFGAGPGPVVAGVSFDVEAGACLAIVGESGSGKSVTARSLLGLAGAGARVQADALMIDGSSVLGLSDSAWRKRRGRSVGLVLQDALVSLDPLRPIGREIADSLRLHTTLGPAARQARVLELLERVGLPDAARRQRQRAGELSGGQRQRALIAAAIALNPPLLIADEPTTALDVTVQAQVLDLLEALKQEGTGILLISHDLAVVSRIADRIAVMSAGRIVEAGPTEQLLGAPEHAITRRMLQAVPVDKSRGVPLTPAGPMRPGSRRTAPAGTAPHLAAPAGTVPHHAVSAGTTMAGTGSPPAAAGTEPAGTGSHQAPPADTAPARTEPREPDKPGGRRAREIVLEATGLVKRFKRPDGTLHAAVDGLSFALERGTTLGIVGESGSGKTTTARLALALTTPDDGEVRVLGQAFSAVSEPARRRLRPRIGAIYQDALSSFDPRLTVGEVLRDAVGGARRPAGRAAASAAAARTIELLDWVGLPAALLGRRPLSLSGGQRQRVGIARALASGPEILVCDEPVSALDVTVQAQVLDLLDELQHELTLSLLFISHDLGVIQHVSDRVAVMSEGRIVEAGDTRELFEAPRHEYTRRLLDSVPRLV